MIRRQDAGLTLVELLVTMSISLLVLAMVGSFMISSFQTQQQVTRIAQATNEAQLTVMQLETALRLSSHVNVVDSTVSDSQVLVARVSDGPSDGDWHCEAWYFDAEVGAILHTSYSGQSTWPWGSSILNWVDLSSGLTGIVDLGGILGDTLDWLFGGGSSAPWTVMAVGISDATASGGAAHPVFASDGSRTATVQFAVESADSATPVVLRTSVSGRQTAETEDPRCY